MLDLQSADDTKKKDEARRKTFLEANIIKPSTSLQFNNYRVIHLVTVGPLSSHTARYSWKNIESSTSLQLEYYRVIHLITAGILSSHPSRYSWIISIHPPR